MAEDTYLNLLAEVDGFQEIVRPLLEHLGWCPPYADTHALVLEIDQLLSISTKYSIELSFAPIPQVSGIDSVANAFRETWDELQRLDPFPPRLSVDGHEVAAYLSAQSANTKPILARGMKLLFLSCCWKTLNMDRVAVVTYANELRLLDQPLSKSNRRPRFVEGFRVRRRAEFGDIFIDHTTQFLKRGDASDLPAKFRDALLFLLGNRPARTSRRRPATVAAPRNLPAAEPQPPFSGNPRLGQYGFPLPEFEEVAPGVTTKTIVVEETVPLIPGEAPDSASIVVVDPRDMDEDVLLAEYGSARRWLQSAQNVTTSSSSVLSEIEKDRFLELVDDLHSPASQERFEATLLLCVSYAIGQDINRVLMASCWKEGVFDEGGGYSLGVIQPDSSYSPSDNFRHFRPLLERVSFTLPKSVREPVAFHTGSRTRRPFLECLRSSPKTLVGGVSGILHELQDEGSFNITAHTTMTGLKNEVLLRTESPLLAYHLCHKEGEAMPAMGWYQSVTASNLREVYDDCASHIFRRAG